MTVYIVKDTVYTDIAAAIVRSELLGLYDSLNGGYGDAAPVYKAVVETVSEAEALAALADELDASTAWSDNDKREFIARTMKRISKAKEEL